MLCQGFLTVLAIQTATAFPAKLLRTPKIYNALITTKQNLLPSEAVPASTGPVFQPLDLSGDPVLLNPEAFIREEPSSPKDDSPRPFAKSWDMAAPVVFYPRYNVYHQLPQSLYPYSELYQPPPVVVPVQRSEPLRPIIPSVEGSSEMVPEDTTDLPTAPPPPSKAAFGFVTNNSPQNGEIPNVPPPPPPMGAPRPAESAEQTGQS